MGEFKNDDKDKIQQAIKKILDNKIYIVIIAVGLMLIIAASTFKTSDLSAIGGIQNNSATNQVKNTSQDGSSQDDEKAMEDKLTKTLEQIDGVGRVQVMIYCDEGEQQVPAYNENKSTSVTQETDNSGGKRNTTQKSDGSTVVVTNDGQNTEPLIIKKVKPKITGVCVVAEGADREVIKLSITQAVMDLFGLTEDKVNVYAMKK
ncbi:MAG: stage III sporulation protein AG [Bacillota bacterium]|nr:stage III sporulation protein AG [Bacillota bacterium]